MAKSPNYSQGCYGEI